MKYTRYEIFDDDGECYGGFMHMFHHLDLPSIVRNNVQKFWIKNLIIPPNFNCEVKCYFTPQGLKKFKKNIETLNRLYSNYFYLGPCCIMNVKEKSIESEELLVNTILYKDDYQVVIKV